MKLGITTTISQNNMEFLKLSVWINKYQCQAYMKKSRTPPQYYIIYITIY